MIRQWTDEEVAWGLECVEAGDSIGEIAEMAGCTPVEVRANLPRRARRLTHKPLTAARGPKTLQVLGALSEVPASATAIAARVGQPMKNVTALLCGLRSGGLADCVQNELGRNLWFKREAAR